MTSILKVLRSAIFGNRPAVGAQQEGVPYVNFADKQFGVVDSSQTPRDLVGVPFFSTTANYNAGQPINYLGNLYVALVNVTAGAWNATQWSLVTSKQILDSKTVYPILSINGSMSISQELGTTGITGFRTFSYILDGFGAGAGGTPAITAAQQTPCGVPGFVYQMNVLISTAAASLSAGDAVYACQTIEGTRVARLGWGTANAQPMSIGFWAYCTITGNIAVAVRNAAANRSYVVDVAITAANTWQWCTVTIPGDTTGTWPIGTVLGLVVNWCVAAGTTYRTTANTWQAGNLLGTAATMNLAASTSNSFNITGVIIVPGTVLPPASMVPFVLPTYADELVACQRYLRYIGYGIQGQAESATQLMFSYIIYMPMRVIPTVTVPLPSVNVRRFYTGGDTNLTISPTIDVTVGLFGGRWAWVMGGGAVVNVGERFQLQTDNVLKLDARL
jgi:hypothetical protein